MKIIRINGFIDKDYKNKILLYSTKNITHINSFNYSDYININGKERRYNIKVIPKRHKSYTRFHSYDDMFTQIKVDIFKYKDDKTVDISFTYEITDIDELIYETFIHVKSLDDVKYVIKIFVEENKNLNYFKFRRKVLKSMIEKDNMDKEPVGIYYYNSLSKEEELFEFVYTLILYKIIYRRFGRFSTRVYIKDKFEFYGYDIEFVEDYISGCVNKDEIEYYIALILSQIYNLPNKLEFDITEKQLDDWYNSYIKKF